MNEKTEILLNGAIWRCVVFRTNANGDLRPSVMPKHERGEELAVSMKNGGPGVFICRRCRHLVAEETGTTHVVASPVEPI